MGVSTCLSLANPAAFYADETLSQLSTDSLSSGNLASAPAVDLGSDFYTSIVNVSTGTVLEGHTTSGSTVTFRVNSSASMVTVGGRRTWHFVSAGDGYYTITCSAANHLALDVCGASSEENAGLEVCTPNGTSAQLWRIVAAGDGSYYLTPKCSPTRVLDLNELSSADNATTTVHTLNLSNAQRFTLTPVADGGETPAISDVKIENVTTEGYDISCVIADDGTIAETLFPTWTSANGQDDLIWHAGTLADGRWTFHVNVSDHKGEHGIYYTHIYTRDGAGNTASCQPDLANICVPDAMTEVDGHTYERFDLADSGLSWTAARDAAVAMTDGGHLVSITSAEENATVTSLLAAGSKDYYWIGGNDLAATGIWAWVDGSAWSFANWSDGDPNARTDENYVAMRKSNGTWFDEYLAGAGSDSSTMGFVAEIDSKWQTSGTCEWRIDGAGLLTIRPANGAETGTLPTWYNPSNVPWYADRDSITAVKVESGVQALTCCSMFRECASLTSADLSGLDTSKVSDMSYMFYGCSALSGTNVTALVTSKVSDFSSMFDGCTHLVTLDVSHFDTSKVQYMNSMFCGCSALTSLDLSGKNTTNLTNLVGAFAYCPKMTGINLDGFNTANVASMWSTFSGDSALTLLDLTSFDTANVVYMTNMFKDCTALKEILVGPGWTTEATLRYGSTNSLSMFAGCTSLVGLHGTTYDSTCVDANYAHVDASWSPGYLTGEEPERTDIAAAEVAEVLASVYSGSGIHPALTVILGGKTLIEGTDYEVSCVDNVNSGTATANITGINGYCGTLATAFEIAKRQVTLTSESASKTFDGESLSADTVIVGGDGFVEGEGADYTASYASNTAVGTAAVTITGQGNFSGTATATFSIVKKPIKAWTESGTCEWMIDAEGMLVVRPANGASTGTLGTWETYDEVPWYSNRSSIKSLRFEPGVSVSGCSYMFQNCKNLVSADLSNLNVSGVTGMNYLFDGCINLRAVSLAGLDTSSVAYMNCMFRNCSSLPEVDLTGLDLTSLKNMTEAFSGCKSLERANLSNATTSAVTSTEKAFYGCSSLAAVDVSTFNTASLVNTKTMFSGCSALGAVDLSGWNTSKLVYADSMFNGCSSLVTIKVGDGWSTDASKSSSMFTGCQSLVGGAGTIFDSSCTSYAYAQIDEGPYSPNPGYLTAALERHTAGSCCWTLDEDGTLTVFSSATSESGFLPIWETYEEVPWREFRDSITSVEVRSGVRAQTCYAMFKDCANLVSIDLGGLDTSGVTNMGVMFYFDSNLAKISAGPKWTTRSVTSGGDMFFGCESLSGGNGTAYAEDKADVSYANVDRQETPAPDGTPTFSFTGRVVASCANDEVTVRLATEEGWVLNLQDADGKDCTSTGVKGSLATLAHAADVNEDGAVDATDARAVQYRSFRGSFGE